MPRGHPATLTNAGKGRPKGSVNKNTGQIKEMILQALDKAGGADYLYTQALDNPGPFMTLVGKVLPMQLVGDPNAPLSVAIIQRQIIEPQKD